MTKTPMYRYLGTNGTIESQVYLEGIYSVKLLKLHADNGKILTDGERRVKIVTIPASEIAKWQEVDMGMND